MKNIQQLKQKLKQKNGFTMIELLIVIVILGILAVIGLGSFSSSQMKARDSRRKSDLRAISDALEVYYNDFGRYPLSDGGGAILGCGVGAQDECSAGDIWQNSDNETTYMVQIPQDPSGGVYYYRTDAEGSFYQLYARLENEQDRDVPTDGEVPAYYIAPGEGVSACGAGDCNYGRASTNETLGKYTAP